MGEIQTPEEDEGVIPNRILSAKNRKRVYNFLISVGPVALFYGVISQEELVVLIGFATSLLVNGMARLNVNPS